MIYDIPPKHFLPSYRLHFFHISAQNLFLLLFLLVPQSSRTTNVYMISIPHSAKAAAQIQLDRALSARQPGLPTPTHSLY